ncbi:MAG TPA: GNAT family N-acetyltransferase [Sphingomicrobium sp.]|nr:GNAT family N-acetyltransferase [Sphingomicrobium sp.]
MTDPRLDALAESARNRGLKLVRSRVRTAGKRRFGKVGLTDASGKAVFGMDAKGPIAKPEEVEEYLRGLGARDWGASLDVPARRRKRAGKKPAATTRAKDEAPSKRPKASPKPQPLLKPAVREAKPADAPRLAALIRELGHEIDEKNVRKNIALLKKAGETPFVATLDKDVVGLCGIHRMAAIHRDKPVGRINILILTEAARGQGLGRMLVEAAQRRLIALGCGRIEITVGDARAEAQAFYRHVGYERSGIRYQKLV